MGRQNIERRQGENLMAKIYGFGEASARPGDPETSHIAAGRVRGERAGLIEKQVVAVLNLMPNGGTWEEITQELKKRKKPTISGSLSPRWKKLRRLGLLEYHYDDDGEVISRINPKSQCPQQVHYITKKARELLPIWKKELEEANERKRQKEEAKKQRAERKKQKEEAKNEQT